MSHAQELITAIQTYNPGRVRAVIEQLNCLSDDEVKHLTGSERQWTRKNYINDRLPGGLDIAAIHLASKAYSAHTSDPSLAVVFNEMVKDLLEAGADPMQEVGKKTIKKMMGGHEVVTLVPGQTAAELCEGRLPPALKQWFAENCDSNKAMTGFDFKKHHSVIAHRNAKLAAWQERKRQREQLGQDMAQDMADDDDGMDSPNSFAIGF